MFIVWSGLGFVVPVAGFVAVMVGGVVISNLNVTQPWSGVISVAAAGIASVALWFFTQHIESEEAKVFIEKATGREIVVRRSAGSFFFIPTRYWAYILPALAVLGSIVATFDPPKG